jgi:hypothetical protein
VTAKVDRSQITIGDRIQYEIDVTYPATGHVELPAVLGNLGDFEVKDYKTEYGNAADGRATAKYLFTISTFTVGAYTLPPQRIEYREANDTSTLVLYTEPTEIKVIRTSPETEKDIADIADVVNIPEPTPWGAIGLGLAMLFLIGFFIWRKRRSKQSQLTATLLLPPYEEALKRLRDLRGARLLGPSQDPASQNQAREFAFALSEILRNYVGRRYGIEALESTTEEFLEKAKLLPLTSHLRDWLRAFCESLDPLKYATAGVAESEGDRLMLGVEEFAEQTKPAPQPTQPAQQTQPEVPDK